MRRQTCTAEPMENYFLSVDNALRKVKYFYIVKTSEGRCVWLSMRVSGIREGVGCENGSLFEVIELVGLETGRKQVRYAAFQNELVFPGN